MCFELNRRSYCYLIAIWTYLVGLFEVCYAAYMMARFGKDHWLLGLAVAWIPIFLAAVCLVVGAYLGSIHRGSKRRLLWIWILVALACCCAIIVIKLALVIGPFQYIGVWRNCLRITAVFLFILLVFSFIYYPYLYMQDLDEELYF